MLVKASAPGSLMLLGEYAVLHGQPALICAVDKRMTVTLAPCTDKKINITSALGDLNIAIADLEISPPFQFVTAVLKKFSPQMTTGCHLNIESAFSEKIGFGSSAAVTVATLAAVRLWLDISFSTEELIAEARCIIQEVQGIASGADVAASVLGGLVSYQMKPLLAEKIPFTQPLTAVYAGYKTPTIDAIRKVQKSFHPQPEIFYKLCEAIGICSAQGLQAIRAQDWRALGKVMNVQHGLLESLGVVTADLSEIVHRLRDAETILGAKISGAGLGDCIIGLGTSTSHENVIPITVGQQGVICEKI